jgi:hypothetical protein
MDGPHIAEEQAKRQLMAGVEVSELRNIPWAMSSLFIVQLSQRLRGLIQLCCHGTDQRI